MEYGEAVGGQEDSNTRIAMTAHHEAGHIVVAAQRGIDLRPEGIMLDSDAAGLACYCKDPKASDESRENVIVSTFAGHMAQHRFCKDQSYPLRSFFEIIFSQDWKEARTLMGDLSKKYWADRTPDDIQKALEEQSESAVDQNWEAIKRVASALLEQGWDPIKPLKSGDRWSEQSEAKYLSGEEVVAVLSEFGIRARISECHNRG